MVYMGEKENAYRVWWEKPERRRQLQYLEVDERLIVKGILRGGVERREPDSSGSRQGETMCGSVPSCSTHSRKYLDCLTQY
jgi:hypothetical protein